MPRSDLETAALRWRKDLLNSEREAASRMVRVYGAAWVRVQEEIANYTRRIKGADDDLMLRLLYRRDAAEVLRNGIQDEIRKFAEYASSEVKASQAAVISAAQSSVQEMVNAQSVGFNLRKPNALAVEALVGYASDGSPLIEVLTRHSGGRAEEMADLLASNVALGISPRQTARQMKEIFGTTLNSALTVARTETLRAYRTASMEVMRANSDVISYWVWISACDRRSCIACFAMHGTRHALDEELDEHPNGRCVAAPVVKSVPVSVTPGSERFEALPQEIQRNIMGKAMHLAYKEGKIEVRRGGGNSVIGVSHSTAWGSTVRVRSLTEILGKEEADGYKARTRPKPASVTPAIRRPTKAPVPPVATVTPTAAAKSDPFDFSTPNRVPPPAPVAPAVPDYLTSTEGYTLPHHISQRIRGMVENTVDFLSAGMTPEEGMDYLDAVARNAILPDDTVSIRIRSDRFLSLMSENSPRFKSQFETKTSGGALDNDYRAEAEEEGLGLDPDDTDPTERPVYGYVGVNNRNVRHYGDVQVVLKQTVRPRTSVTFEDSLGNMADGTLAGVPMNAPSLEGINYRHRRDMAKSAGGGSPEQAAVLFRESTQQWEYIEAQVHGGVGVSEFEKVIFHRGSADDDTKRLLQQYNIPFEEVDDE